MASWRKVTPGATLPRTDRTRFSNHLSFGSTAISLSTCHFECSEKSCALGTFRKVGRFLAAFEMTRMR
uniref:Uncharacterized protein n=1 Tax=Candidatus Kentrum sp. FW TaxID=2126338 RepID=A0A450TVZ0_9GAMM|nr:MAG: hypothetical protein BECKFW1821C_GA0114237_104315 [Candidatus Kentron sp. FW]